MGGTLVLALGLILHVKSGSPLAQDIGNIGQLLGSLFAGLACLRAARRGGPERRGWTLLSVAAFVWTAGAVLWAYYGFGREHAYPFPSVADLGFLGFALPAVAGLLAFPRSSALLVSRLRAVMDGLLIASAVLFVSWATVLGTVYQSEGYAGLSRLTALAYPCVDAVLGSMVLVLALRRPRGARLPWAILGGGLVVLAVSDSIYVSLSTTGVQGIGTPLQAGWAAAFVLIGLATLAPVRPGEERERAHFSLGQELLPYLPVLAAIVIAGTHRVGRDDPFLLANALVLLTALAVQQLFVVKEKISLANTLETKVMERTALLESADSRYRSLVESSDDAIVGKTLEGVVTTWNMAAERLYGYTAAEMVGQPVGAIVPAHRRQEENEILAGAGKGRQLKNYETERLRKDGSLIPVALTVSPILDGDRVVGISAIGHDISDRRREAAELALVRNEALAASQAKSEFLATMSHEIRTPMNGVIGLTGLLLDTSLSQTQQKYATGIRGAGEALLGIINDILDFSKLEAGKVELDEVSFDPRQLVEEVGVLLAETASSKGLELLAYCAPDVPSQLSGDSGRIRQVLINLASNAVKFTERGEVVIRADYRSGAGAEGSMLHIAVTDTGIGIAAQDHERLFEPFSQADASTTRQYGGTGLGLAICRRLVTAMDGRLGLRSEPGRGSTFWFDLPLQTSVPASTPRLQHELTVGMRVLVVDDNETNRFFLQEQLHAWHIQSDAVGDGLAALAQLREAAAAGSPYSVAVLDMCMPGMDGLMLAQHVAADADLVATSVMLLSSALPLDEQEGRDAGIRRFLTKPVRHSELYDAIIEMAAPLGVRTIPERVQQSPTVPARPSRGLVLVAEDNAVNQMVSEGILASLGYQVHLACTGREALDALERSTYAAVLMDCHMPEMDGYQATAEIRRREGTRRHTPIVAMTAGVLKEDRERCLAAGMDDFVPKPVDVAVLDEVLARAIAGPAPHQPTDGPEPDGNGEYLDRARLDLLRRLGPADGWGLLPSVSAAFLEEAPSHLAAMRAQLELGGGIPLAAVAHQLKGSAANIGALAVSSLCGALEVDAGSGSHGAHELLNELEEELGHAGQALARELPVPA